MKNQFENETLLSINEDEHKLIIPKNFILKKLKITRNGYGRCKLCDCNGYISKNDGSHVCKECKHHKSQHHS